MGLKTFSSESTPYQDEHSGVCHLNIAELEAIVGAASSELREMSLKGELKAVAAWKERFKSFRGGDWAEAQLVASREEGRRVLSSALDVLVHEVDSGYADFELYQHLGTDLASIWPNDAKPPKISSPKNDNQKIIRELIMAPFHSGDTERSNPKKASSV